MKPALIIYNEQAYQFINSRDANIAFDKFLKDYMDNGKSCDNPPHWVDRETTTAVIFAYESFGQSSSLYSVYKLFLTWQNANKSKNNGIRK